MPQLIILTKFSQNASREIALTPVSLDGAIDCESTVIQTVFFAVE